MKTTIITVIVLLILFISCKHDTCRNRCAAVQVVDKNSGLGIKNAKVYFIWNEGGWNGWFQSKKFLAEAITDKDGYASMYSDTAILDGSIEVYAEAGNYEPSTKGVFLDSRAGWTPEKITLNPYGYLNVHILDTTRDDSFACVEFYAGNFCGLGIDSNIIFNLPSQNNYDLKYYLYRGFRLQRYSKIIDITGNDTTMVEIKF